MADKGRDSLKDQLQGINQRKAHAIAETEKFRADTPQNNSFKAGQETSNVGAKVDQMSSRNVVAKDGFAVLYLITNRVVLVAMPSVRSGGNPFQRIHLERDPLFGGFVKAQIVGYYGPFYNEQEAVAYGENLKKKLGIFPHGSMEVLQEPVINENFSETKE